MSRGTLVYDEELRLWVVPEGWPIPFLDTLTSPWTPEEKAAAVAWLPEITRSGDWCGGPLLYRHGMWRLFRLVHERRDELTGEITKVVKVAGLSTKRFAAFMCAWRAATSGWIGDKLPNDLLEAAHAW